MGHTVTSQRIVLDTLYAELRDYGKALRASERELYESMLKRAFTHYSSISYTDSYHVWALLLLSILLEQEKEIESLSKKVESVESMAH
jgi:hypothetical protein